MCTGTCSGSAQLREFTEVTISFINLLVDQTIPTANIGTFSNQKPCVDRSVPAAVNARTTAYNKGLSTSDMVQYKADSYNIWRAVREAKRRYRKQVESHFQLNDSRHLWCGLRTIIDFKGKSPTAPNANSNFADKLNTFYAQFEINSANTIKKTSDSLLAQYKDN